MNSFNANKRYTVVGLGATGRSVIRFLQANGARVFAVDQAEQDGEADRLKAEFPGLCFSLGVQSGDCLAETDVLVVSPGVPRDSALVVAAQQLGLEIIGDIELFARVVERPIVAVTGTNGKSTVVSMLRACGVASRQCVVAGGNLGTPALDLLKWSADLYVLELSSYQLEMTTSLQPVAAALLNVMPDHLDRYPGGFVDYVAAKQRVFEGALTCIVPAGDERAAPAQLNASQRTITVEATVDGTGDVGLVSHQGADWIAFDDSPVVRVDEIGVVGEHNVVNACFAVALARVAGIDDSAIRSGLAAFKGLPHRTQTVRELHGVRYINDSKGTNVGATCVALGSMVAPTVLIAGGLGKAQDFSPLASALALSGRAVVVFGQDAERIAAAVGDVLPVHRVPDLQEAVRLAQSLSNDGDTVLFSPACASFDMFRNFEERGHAFIQSVEALGS